MANPSTKPPLLNLVYVSIRYRGNIETEQSKKMQIVGNITKINCDQKKKKKNKKNK